MRDQYLQLLFGDIDALYKVFEAAVITMASRSSTIRPLHLLKILYVHESDKNIITIDRREIGAAIDTGCV